MKVGLLTAGGDCPGLNAAISTVARLASFDGNEAIGIRHGFRGLADGDFVSLSDFDLDGIIARGGTVLGASSFDPYREEAVERIEATMRESSLDLLMVIGGEHSMDIARRLHSEASIPVVGIPKTIDNDVMGTEFTFGFDTAVQIATDAIDRLRTTAESHDRVMVVEVMGRNTGWIALWSAIASGVDAVLIPEAQRSVADLSRSLERIHGDGQDFSIVVAAEGADLIRSSGEKERVLLSKGSDQYGYERLGGIAVELAREIAEQTGFESRATILGHVQRGGTPTSTDRVLATRLAATAYDAALSGDVGTMAALRDPGVVLIPLADVQGVKRVDDASIELARRLDLL